jgi:hypothetical protein
MKTTQDIEVFKCMKKYGGAFVRALGEAGLAADQENTRRIKRTWSKYYADYLEMVKQFEINNQ